MKIPGPMDHRFSLPLILALAIAVCPAAAGPAAASAGEVSVAGLLGARAFEARGQASWLDGGFGRLAAGSEAAGESDGFASGQLHVTLDWTPASSFGVLLHGLARAEPDVVEGDEAGIVEAYLHGSWRARRNDTLRWQLGHFIVPTSRENVEIAWSSPYTITYSALNTWIGEEVRPTGLLAEYSLAVGSVDELRFGASAFGGNDAAGALLAWRGWAMGDRLSTYGETVPLPPITSLGDGGEFRAQNDRGSRPFGSDLDSRLGWAGYLAYVHPQRASVRWSHYDNRGDRGFHDGEYSWRTEFDLFGVDLHSRSKWSFAGEYMQGSTGMGFNCPRCVDLDYAAYYLLVSFRPGSFRMTLRYDYFDTEDRDAMGGMNADLNDEHGEAWTAALFWEHGRSLRLGVELLDLDSERPEAARSGFDADTDARSVTLELRYYFDW